MENYPDSEKLELEKLYVEKGMTETDAKTMVYIIAKNKKVWVDIMMVEEIGIIESDESPQKNALRHLLHSPHLDLFHCPLMCWLCFSPFLNNQVFCLPPC